MAALRRAAGARVGLPATKWMAEVGAFFLRTDTELMFKSRRVIPTRLEGSGFSFRIPTWEEAAEELMARAPGTAPDVEHVHPGTRHAAA